MHAAPRVCAVRAALGPRSRRMAAGTASDVASAGCVFRSSQLMRPTAYMDRWGVKPESGPINDAAHAAAGPQAGSPPPRLAATVAEVEDTVSATHERAAARGCALSTAEEVRSSKRKPS